jgi:serine/threonine-protein kinase
VSATARKTLGRYQLVEEIGRGMMGVVYRAQDPDLGRAVALKTVRLAFSVAPEELAAFEKRFLAEARVAARLSHPGIVVVHDVGRDPATGTLFIAFEHLEGRTLADLAADGTPLPWPDALRLTAGIARALHHAHLHGVIHRDVKPANVMVLPGGEPKIMDFGIAKVPASQLTAAGEFFGTPSYMSPEQAAGEPLDGRSDLFSLGSILYLLLTGRRAFDAGSIPAILARVTGHDPTPPSQVVAGIPSDADYLVARSLAKKVADRYPDGQTFADDVEDVRGGRPPRHRPAWQPPPRVDATAVRFGVESGAARHPTARLAAAPPTGSVPIPPAGRRRWALAAGAMLVAAALVGFALSRNPAPSAGEPPALPGFSLPALVVPARLHVDFEHHLQWGTLRVFVDDVQVLEEPLESRVVKKVLTVRIRKGTISKLVDVPPGEHNVRVQVQGDGWDESRRIRGSFESGATRRLDAGLSRLSKEVTLQWGAVTRE